MTAALSFDPAVTWGVQRATEWGEQSNYNAALLADGQHLAELLVLKLCKPLPLSSRIAQQASVYHCIGYLCSQSMGQVKNKLHLLALI